MKGLKKPTVGILMATLMFSNMQLYPAYGNELNGIAGDVNEQRVEHNDKNIKYQNNSSKENDKKEIINIPDTNLKKAINEILHKDLDADITRVELESIDRLYLDSNNIKNLEGIQYCINLTDLILSNNEISDINVLSQLKRLWWVDLSNNNISDISALSNNESFHYLDLSNNNISDISALSNIYGGSLMEGTINILNLSGNPLDLNDYKTKEVIKNLYINGFTVDYRIEFNDTEGHWAEETINSFTNQGYINGYEDNTFRPNASMTRAEFVKVVNIVFGFNEKGTVTFNDVKSSDWFYDEIAIAQKAGYINGKSETTFAPQDKITRQEVAVILTNIKNNKDTNYDKINQFTDGYKTSEWAKSSVEGAIEAGYLSGDDKGLLNPTSNITRAEVVTMLSRVE